MKKIKKVLLVVLCVALIFGTCVCLTSCRESERVSYNISQEADNFNVVRRLVIINAISDKPMFELIGKFSFELEGESGARRMIVVVEDEDGKYYKHSVGLPEVALWDVQDISGAYVDKYKYQVNFLPEMIVPVEIVSND